MPIQLKDNLLHELEDIALQEQRDVNELVEEILVDYVSKKKDDEALRAEIRQVMQKHAELLEKLAKN